MKNTDSQNVGLRNKTTFLLLPLLFVGACLKTDDPPAEARKIFLREYPTFAPAAGAKIELKKSSTGGSLKTVGVFTADANGVVETDEEFSAKWSQVVEGGGYIPTVVQNDTLPIPIYYVARPAWVRLRAHNVAPVDAEDVCIVWFEQTDPMMLSSSTLLHGYDVLDGIFEKTFQGASVDEQFLIRLAGGVAATMSVGYSYGVFAPNIDSTLQINVPPGDTLEINFEY
jgi:hypothetical protein